METSIKALKWVETTLFVGQGRYIIEGDEAAIEYEIYKSAIDPLLSKSSVAYSA